MFGVLRRKIRENGGEYRLGRRGSFLGRLAIASWQWSISLCKFSDDDRWVFHIGPLWVQLWPARTPPKDEMLDRWGFAVVDMALHLNWGDKYKIIWFPWMMDHCRTEVMLKDGSFVPYEKYPAGCRGRAPEPEGMYSEKFSYCYVLKSGEVQNRTATVTAERRTWCWRARPFKWVRWPSKTATSINVEFDGEVGERSGSWKGGCIGCGYDLRPDETPEQCLRRMERERTFR